MSVYEIITDQVVKALESGVAPWRKPWHAAKNGPRNIEGRPYRGMNVFLLLSTGHDSPYWLTWRQIKDRGGMVKKGEAGTIVVFWKINKYKKTDDAGNPTVEKVPMLRYYRVWNLEQIDGINPPIRDDMPTLHFDPIEAAEKVVAGYPNAPAMRHTGEGRAYYRPGMDDITLPPREAFESEQEYYSTLFHEMTHSTGHKSRLDRHTEKDQFVFASHSYGREELVAEMGAAFLSGEAGILPQTFENSKNYLGSWIKTIKEDTKAVVIAASRAQRAADYILGKHAPEYEESENDE